MAVSATDYTLLYLRVK